MNVQAKLGGIQAPIIGVRETMRIAGRRVDGEAALDVFNPWDNSVVGTVPRANPAQVAEAFQIACDYKPKLSRYDRQKILMKAAELLVARKDEIARLITSESGLCLKDSQYEVGRAFDVFSLAGQLCILDDSQTFSCDLTPHGKQRKIFTLREPLNAISAIRRSTTPEHGGTSPGAGDRHQQLRGAEAHRARRRSPR